MFFYTLKFFNLIFYLSTSLVFCFNLIFHLSTSLVLDFGFPIKLWWCCDSEFQNLVSRNVVSPIHGLIKLVLDNNRPLGSWGWRFSRQIRGFFSEPRILSLHVVIQTVMDFFMRLATKQFDEWMKKFQKLETSIIVWLFKSVNSVLHRR